MSEEQKREICKSYFHEMGYVEIAEIEEVDVKEIMDTITWGKCNGIFDELSQMKQNAEGE